MDQAKDDIMQRRGKTKKKRKAERCDRSARKNVGGERTGRKAKKGSLKEEHASKNAGLPGLWVGAFGRTAAQEDRGGLS